MNVGQATRLPEVANMVERTLADGVAPHNHTIVIEINDEIRYYDVEVVPVQSADTSGGSTGRHRGYGDPAQGRHLLQTPGSRQD